MRERETHHTQRQMFRGINLEPAPSILKVPFQTTDQPDKNDKNARKEEMESDLCPDCLSAKMKRVKGRLTCPDCGNS